jgi:hypothetical protein
MSYMLVNITHKYPRENKTGKTIGYYSGKNCIFRSSLNLNYRMWWYEKSWVIDI